MSSTIVMNKGIVIATEKLILDNNELSQLFSLIDNEMPVAVVSVIGQNGVENSIFFDILLSFLKDGCNNTWTRSKETELIGLRFENLMDDQYGIKASLIPINFSDKNMAVVILNVNINDDFTNFSSIYPKLQSVCANMSNILLYMKPFVVDEKIDSNWDSFYNKLASDFASDSAKSFSLYNVYVNTPEKFISDRENKSHREGENRATELDKSIKSKMAGSVEKFEVCLPNLTDKNFPTEGDKVTLKKYYKGCLNEFLYAAFSINRLLEVISQRKCYKAKEDFINRLQKGVMKANSNEDFEDIHFGIHDPANENKNLPKKYAASKKYEPEEESNSRRTNNAANIAPSVNSDKTACAAAAMAQTVDLDKRSSLAVEKTDNFDETVNQSIIYDVEVIDKRLAKYAQYIQADMEKLTPDLLQDVRQTYVTSLNTLENLKSKVEKIRSREIRKKVEISLKNRINKYTSENFCLVQLSDLHTTIGAKFAQQLYYSAKEFDKWTEHAKEENMDCVTQSCTKEVPEWFEKYMNLLLEKATKRNTLVRDVERQSIDESISSALGFYETKMKSYDAKIFFSETELLKVHETSLSIVRSSLEHATKLDNQKNTALEDFEVLKTVEDKAKKILEDLKIEVLQKNYTAFNEIAQKAMAKAFEKYKKELMCNVRKNEELKVTKLYEFHCDSKNLAMEDFYNEVSSIPKELIGQHEQTLSEKMDAEHKKIRETEIKTTNSPNDTTPILGIQFGLTEFRFGIYRDEKPVLCKPDENISTFSNCVDLENSISVGKSMKVSSKSTIRMENVLLGKVGHLYDTVVMGTQKKLQQEVIVSLVFSYIKSTAATYFKNDIYKCVISVPNNFDHIQRQMIKDSASFAGLTVLRIMSESTAAAVACYFSRELKRDWNSRSSVNLLVYCCKSENEIDSCSVFNVRKDQIKMLSSSSPAFLADAKKTGTWETLKSLFRTPPTDNEHIILDAIGKLGEIPYGVFVKSGQCAKTFTPNKSKITKFCKASVDLPYMLLTVQGTIYYAEQLRLNTTFSVNEALPYHLSLEPSRNSGIKKIERNTSLPLEVPIDISFPNVRGENEKKVDVSKIMGEKSNLGSYSVDCRHKSSWNTTEMLFNFDNSGILTIQGFINTNTATESTFVMHQTANVNQRQEKEIIEKIKEISNLEKIREEQKGLRATLEKELARIKQLVDKKSLSDILKNTVENTLQQCKDAVKDKSSNPEALSFQLERLKKVEETFLK